MNLRDLRYLAAVAEHRHFGRAAEACHVSQPTLSTQIKKLEEYLDVVLIERSNRSVMLTPIGEVIVGHARRLLDEADSIIAVARESRDPMSGELNLGVIPTVAPYLLPRVLPVLKKALPRLKICLFERQTHMLERDLAEGRLDAAVLALPSSLPHSVEETLYVEPFLLTVPKKHPLAASREITLDALTGESILLLEDGHCLRDQALEVCGAAGVAEDTSFAATSLETLRQMVQSNAGITLMPALATDGSRQVRYLPFAEPPPSRTIGLVWRNTSPRQHVLQAMTEILREADLPL